MAESNLILFDVDGTLVDSQSQIIDAMQKAFLAIDHPLPTHQEILSIVGLSLSEAFSHLLPNKTHEIREQCSEIYKFSFAEARSKGSKPKFYPGIIEVLTELNREPNYFLGIATGKSRRGLNALLEAYEMAPWFATIQVADDHPSKPHPSMIKAALKETSVDPSHTVMIGAQALIWTWRDQRVFLQLASVGGITQKLSWQLQISWSSRLAICRV